MSDETNIETPGKVWKTVSVRLSGELYDKCAGPAQGNMSGWIKGLIEAALNPPQDCPPAPAVPAQGVTQPLLPPKPAKLIYQQGIPTKV